MPNTRVPQNISPVATVSYVGAKYDRRVCKKKKVSGKTHNEKIRIFLSVTKYQKNFDRMSR